VAESKNGIVAKVGARIPSNGPSTALGWVKDGGSPERWARKWPAVIISLIRIGPKETVSPYDAGCVSDDTQGWTK